MKKVYCQNCKKFEVKEGVIHLGTNECIVVVDNWRSPNDTITVHCEAFNSDNDCPFYDSEEEH